MLVAKLPPHGDDLGEPFRSCITLHNACRYDRDILCDQLGIEAIVLSQHAAGAGELTKFVGVNPSHRQTCREQDADDAALVAATWLDPDRGDRQAVQTLNQLAPARSVVIHRKAAPVRQHQHVETIFRYLDSTVAMPYHLHALPC
jgi:hypothetical protein